MTTVNLTNVTGIADFFRLPNQTSDGYFWFAMLIGFFVIFLFMSSYYAGWENGLLISSFVTMVLGIFMVYLRFIAPTYGAIFMGIILFIMMLIGFVSSKTAS